ncbi:hypothetical protein KUTeg_015613 [Tegillarca granosa]|uniref:PID domain-containing protein n=1 Tax=Tegillarca granosa TaxID=220873 RepID=A0ABQ9ER56_TEGGR|nr:hypothetical protein KUTeg_015613 [Tegillarca granosa]
MDTSSASLKVARDYFVSSQSNILIPNRDFGKRKFINVGINRQPSGSKLFDKQKQSSVNSDGQLGFAAMRAANKQWVHPPEALLRGHIVYNVKQINSGYIPLRPSLGFLGESVVDSAKGSEVVKDAIRKRKFNKTVKKAEGQKTPKVELTISADGVTIQDPKTKIIMHQYPLHRISYCADDKSDKRIAVKQLPIIITLIYFGFQKNFATKWFFCNNKFFVFSHKKCYFIITNFKYSQIYILPIFLIGKFNRPIVPETSVNFLHEHFAEEITLTIGQAFDLAYRRFLETSGKDIDMRRKFEMLLKKENDMLRKKVQELEKLKDKDGVDQLKSGYQMNEYSEIRTEVAVENTSQGNPSILYLSSTSPAEESSTDDMFGSYVDSENNQHAVVGRRLENLVLENSPQHNGTVNNGNQSPVSPPPPSSRSRSSTHPPPQQQQTSSASSPSPASNDLAGLINPFGAAPSSSESVDAFGMGAFNPGDQFFNSSISSRDKELMDIESGFSQGLSFGTDDFSLADLDPLSPK